MSSFYDDASLVMIPSCYKVSTVLCEKPTDGSGDLTFTRTGDTATRVNSSGLVEKVRTNLVTFSEDFANAAWTKNNATVTSNTQANPVNGAVTADTITATASVGYVSSAAIALSAIPYTISMYAKKSNVDWVSIEVSDGVANSAKSWYNIANGTLGTTGGTYTITGRTITSAGNGWYRCTLTFNVTSATNYSFIPFFVASDGALSVNGNAGFGFGAQVETTDFGATPYIPTTTAAVSVGPVANLPRLDYLSSSCPRLLLEPQRTNLVTYSEQFDNAAWTKSNATITANTVVSPDGYTNADTCTATGGSNGVIGYATSSGNNSITYSVFVKAGTQSTFQIAEAFYFGTSTIFNLSTGTVTSGTGTITSYGNGWYRCTHTQAYGAGQTNVTVVFNTTASSGTFHLWGAQFEVGSFATSYIPTLAASATRSADATSKTGISSLIGQTEGTLYAEIVRTTSTATDGFWVGVNAGTVTDWIFFGIEATGARFYVRVNNVVVAEIYPTMGVGTHKMALGYKSGQIVGYIDGVQVFSSTATFTLTSLTKFQIGAINPANDTTVTTAAINQALLFKTRLTNAQLAELTTI